MADLRQIALVSGSTVGSRVLGLVRDALIFAVLGASVWSSAFLLAFTLPNLFRRLFGEGALTSALVPVLSRLREEGGPEAAFRCFNRLARILFAALAAIVAAGAAILLALADGGALGERWALAARLGAILLPYMICVCLAAAVAAALNVLERFGAAARAPIWLNLAMIVSLAAAWVFAEGEAGRVLWLCGGVLAGGGLQLLGPASDLRREGWRPSEKARPDDGAPMAELGRLFLPGIFGAAILQLNILVSRLFAYALDETAVSYLYGASRLMELPLGVFAVSVTTVTFPALARAFAGRYDAALAEEFRRGCRRIAAIVFPAAAGLAVLGLPVVEVVFGRGAFGAEDARRMAPLVAIYGLGLPFYAAATFFTRALHANRAMRAPVRAAAVCLLANAALSWSLMGLLGAVGLALANVLAAALQAVLLGRALRSDRALGWARLAAPLGRMAGAAGAMALACAAGAEAVGAALGFAGAGAWIAVGALVPGGALLYFALLRWMGADEPRELLALAASRGRGGEG